ncbi:Protein of unknown function [Cotesia congregata]|uniref:Uncharacterized protein n=1 Tax=Cotesia congregata TaxID=51543 RepID=A0A8J2HP37_COTCN|nr:Protein of unknown function [Cotesia congregata]
MIKALVRPSSRFSAHDLAGSHTPDTGAYPDGPPMSSLKTYHRILFIRIKNNSYDYKPEICFKGRMTLDNS